EREHLRVRLLADRLGRLLDSGGIAGEDRQTCPLMPELGGNGPAEPLAGRGDDGNLAGQTKVHMCVPPLGVSSRRRAGHQKRLRGIAIVAWPAASPASWPECGGRVMVSSRLRRLLAKKRTVRRLSMGEIR